METRSPTVLSVPGAPARTAPRARAARERTHHRVALVTEYYYPHLGGICEHVHFLARELRRRGHHADIITSHIGSARSEPGVIRIGRSIPVYGNGSMARVTVGLGLRRRLHDLLRAGEYDIVHVHTPLVPTLPLLAVQAAEVPVVGTIHTYFHGAPLFRLFRSYCQRVLDRLDAVICVSRTAAEAHARYFSADWTILPNGVDVEHFRPDVPRPPELDPARRHILFLGRLDPRNGLATLIRAFRRVRARRPDTRLVVVGDGPLLGHYRALADGDPDILFLGARREDRPCYYAHADVYACPTTKASFGITLLEAMACGTPIVCSDIAGFRDVVEHEREALLVPCGESDALASSLLRVLDDRSLALALGAAGIAGAAAYAWPAVAERILEVYAGVSALGAAAR